MAEYLIQDTTLDAIADAINAKTGGSSAMTPAQMVTAIGSISSGGVVITNGVVWKTLDANGNPTEVDFYGSVVPNFCFGFNGYGVINNPLNYVQKINWKTPVTTIKSSAFARSQLRNLIIPETVTTIEYTVSGIAVVSTSLVSVNYLSSAAIDYEFCRNCTALTTVYAPNITQILCASNSGASSAFSGCTALEDVEIGKVGTTVTTVHSATFYNCTQNSLTITVYTTAQYVDTILSNIRNGATNATIIIKASEVTTYNDTPYAAGDTIITSEVTP